MRRLLPLAALTLLGATLEPRAPGASGYALREQSAAAQGASLAGAAALSDDPSMLAFNPAAGAGLQGLQLSTVGSLVVPRVELESGSARRAPALGGSAITGRLGGDIASDALIPAFFLSLPLAETLRAGLAVTAPFGLVTKYPSDFIGRYHGLTSELQTVNISPSLSWRPIVGVSLGAGLQIQHADARISNAVDFGAVLAGRGARVAPGSADGRLTLAGDDLALGWTLGGQWQPRPGTSLGLGFRSALHHEVEGNARFEGVPAALAPAVRDGGARVKLTTPESLAFGLAQAITPRLTLLAGAEWTNWSRYRSLVVLFENGLPPNVTEQNWRDTWFLSFGGAFRATETVTLRAGVAWDQSPVPEATRGPRIPDGNRYWLSAGATWAASPRVALTAAYTHIIGQATDVALAAGGPADPNFLRGDLAGRYRASVDILSAQLRLQF